MLIKYLCGILFIDATYYIYGSKDTVQARKMLLN